MYDLLICEDKPVILMGLQKLTAGFGLPIGEIHLAEDGQQALQIFSQQKRMDFTNSLSKEHSEAFSL